LQKAVEEVEQQAAQVKKKHMAMTAEKIKAAEKLKALQVKAYCLGSG